jgi:hypothetical protein
MVRRHRLPPDIPGPYSTYAIGSLPRWIRDQLSDDVIIHQRGYLEARGRYIRTGDLYHLQTLTGLTTSRIPIDRTCFETHTRWQRALARMGWCRGCRRDYRLLRGTYYE